MERKLGRPGAESIGALATAADYRVVYVRIGEGKICAEPPPDAAGQFAAVIAAAISGPLEKQTVSADAQAGMALSMKQLFKRTQGVQFYRDGLFALCNLYMNDVIDNKQYLTEVQALRLSAKSLIESEIQNPDNDKGDETPAPTLDEVRPKPKEKPKEPTTESPKKQEAPA